MTLCFARPHALFGTAVTTLALGMTVALATPAEAASVVHFGRIQYDSPGRDTRSNASLNAEYVRVINSSGHTVSLRGWTIRDLAGHMYHFRPSSIGAHQIVVVHIGRGRDTQTHRYWNQNSYIWNNTGDAAGLRNAAGVRVDVCSWGDGPGYKNC